MPYKNKAAEEVEKKAREAEEAKAKEAEAAKKKAAEEGACHYCGGVGGKHRLGCPVSTGKTKECVEELCPGCTFRGRPCSGPLD